MATTTWQPIPSDETWLADPIPPDGGPPGPALSDLIVVRKLVTEILAEPGTHYQSELTDDAWDNLCRSIEHDSTEQDAVSRLLLVAYAMRDGKSTVVAEPAPIRPVEPAPVSVWIPEAPVLGPVQLSGMQKSSFDELIPVGFASPPGQPAGLPEHPMASEVGVSEAATSTETWTPMVDNGGPEFVPDGSDEPAGRRHSRTGLRSSPNQSDRRRAHSKSRGRAMEERQRQKLLTVASWIRNIGAIILLFVAWQLWGTAIQQHHAQATLRGQFEAKVHYAPAKLEPGISLVPATTSIPDPPQGTVMAEMQIPKIGLRQIVVSGTNESDLNKGPGHYLGTAMPGQAGNVAIAGHRTTHGAPFNRLAELAVGDPIYLTAANGERLTYIVSAVPVAVSPRDVTVLNNFGDNRLTLTTCNPEYSAVQRLIVVAAFLPPGATQPPKLAKGFGKSYSLIPSVTSGWNTSLLPWLTLELAALIALGLFFRRLSGVYGRSGRWLILGPVWLALLLATFETLTNFLPAAV